MRLRSVIKVSLLCVAAVLTLGAMEHYIGGAHMRKKLGQPNASNATCFNCHFVSTNRLLWAKPRPHHDSPAGLAFSPDGTKLYIALYDRDEIAVADLPSRKVLRRSRVTGGPFGLAIDPSGNTLYVTCKDEDRLAVLEAGSLHQIDTVPVGMGPVAVAFASTKKGPRLIVANSISDDLSILSLSPLAEITRPAAGREPFALSTSPDGTRVIVANRLVNLASVKAIPASEVTVVDPATARVVQRPVLDSAHLSEGVAVVPGRPWV